MLVVKVTSKSKWRARNSTLRKWGITKIWNLCRFKTFSTIWISRKRKLDLLFNSNSNKTMKTWAQNSPIMPMGEKAGLKVKKEPQIKSTWA